MRRMFSHVGNIIGAATKFTGDSMPGPQGRSIRGKGMRTMRYMGMACGPGGVSVKALLSIFFAVIGPCASNVRKGYAKSRCEANVCCMSKRSAPRVACCVTCCRGENGSEPIDRSYLIFGRCRGRGGVQPPVHARTEHLRGFCTTPRRRRCFLEGCPSACSPVSVGLLRRTKALRVLA